MPKKYTEIYVEMRIIARQIITIVGEIFKLIFLRSHVMWKNPKNAKKKQKIVYGTTFDDCLQGEMVRSFVCRTMMIIRCVWIEPHEPRVYLLTTLCIKVHFNENDHARSPLR